MSKNRLTNEQIAELGRKLYESGYEGMAEAILKEYPNVDGTDLAHVMFQALTSELN